MTYFVKVIPPSKRARIHDSECRHCRNGEGQKNQDKSSGPTYWSDPFPDLDQANKFMSDLGARYLDVGLCLDCLPPSR